MAHEGLDALGLRQMQRARELLRQTPSAPAGLLLEILLADWRRHLGSEEPPDDTTVVVVRRAG